MEMRKMICLALTALLAVACNNGDIEGDLPVATKDFLNVESSMTFQSEEESKDLNVTANCSWQASTNAQWVTLSPSSGTNDGTITVTVSKNTSTADRTATITISGGKNMVKNVTVRQAKPADGSQIPSSGDNLPPS